MPALYEVTIRSAIGLDRAWSFFESLNIEILYGTEEDDKLSFLISLDSEKPLPAWKEILSCSPTTLPAIDWESQWKEHGYRFREGYVHVDLADFTEKQKSPGCLFPNLRLKPGPGFGDLSHITTRLALELLIAENSNAITIDIGSGSGILALSAAALGAPFAYGIDIDPEAVLHAFENSVLNNLEHRCAFFTPREFTVDLPNEPLLILMNMIGSEQMTAWDSLPDLHGRPATYITTGILEEERESYLREAENRGWIFRNETTKEGWTAFVFTCKESSVPDAH